MAWKTKNNIPMPQEAAYERLRKYGYEPIDQYINNRTRMKCYDSDGYIVKVSLDSLGRCKSYQRFSPTCNEENFIFNLIKWGINNNYPSLPFDYYPSKTPKHTMLKCRCECGNEFDVDFVVWHRGVKVRCNKCTNKLSNIKRTVKEYLDENHIIYKQQFTFDECIDKRKLPFDFYLQEYNMCIEVDGEQHFASNSHFYDGRTKGSIEDRIKKDAIKTQYCIDNNIKLIRLKYNIVRNNEFIEILNNELNIH